MLVEAALVLPVILTLTLGIIEFGLIFKDSLTISNGTRSGARIGSSDGQSTLADYDILQAIKSGTSALTNNGTIVGVLVYEASPTTATGSVTSPSAVCQAFLDSNSTSTTGNSTTGTACNYYPGSFITTMTSASFTGVAGAPGSWWLPSARVIKQSNSGNPDGGPDYLGVVVKINHNYVTKLIGSSRYMSDTTVMRLEPSPS